MAIKINDVLSWGNSPWMNSKGKVVKARRGYYVISRIKGIIPRNSKVLSSYEIDITRLFINQDGSVKEGGRYSFWIILDEKFVSKGPCYNASIDCCVTKDILVYRSYQVNPSLSDAL